MAKLTEATVKALEPAAPGRKYRLVWDDEVKGFGVRVTEAGTKSYVINYRIDGRERRYTIGNHPDWRVTTAREEAKTLKRRVDRGEDPMAERQERRDAPTVNDLCDRYEAEHLPKKRPSSQRNDRAMLANDIRPRLGKLKVEDVQYEDIDRLHRSFSGKYKANRVLALCSKMFNLAIKWRMRTDNPCRGIERFSEAKRERYLDGAERAALLIALQEYAANGGKYRQTANAFRLAMLSGARIGEVLRARWEDIDFAKGRWTKDGATTKQKTTHHAILNAPALQLVSEIKAASESKWVFPNAAGDGPQEGYKGAWESIRQRATVHLWAESDDPRVAKLIADLKTSLDRLPTYAEAIGAAKAAKLKLPAGLTTFRVHDLRHSFASEGASAGLSLHMIGALLGHTQPQTTARYAHLMDDPLRQAAERIGSRLTTPEAKQGQGGAG